jgi:hypothetical protein
MTEILTFLKEEADKSNGIENITEEQQKEIKKKLEKHFKGSGIIDYYLIIKEQVETAERMIGLSNGIYDIETLEKLYNMALASKTLSQIRRPKTEQIIAKKNSEGKSDVFYMNGMEKLALNEIRKLIVKHYSRIE